MATVLVAALGWFVEIWLATRRGEDTLMGAIFDVFAALALGIIPMVAGTIASIRSQRAGDIAFSVVMIVEGIGLAVLGILS
jgi:hypothetical protein